MNKKLSSRIVALVGNPNCGKTVLFNALTDSDEKVGNWPGVTVERKTGTFRNSHAVVQVVDLPGIYSTSVVHEGALDEKITCEYLLCGEADLIVNVLDGSNLVRNLYLTLQLLEMGLPVVLAVNMLDIVKRHGVILDLQELSALTGCPVVGLVASRGEGVAELKRVIATVPLNKPSQPARLQLPEGLQHHLRALADFIRIEMPSHASRATWLALRLLEHDQYAATQVTEVVLQEAKRHENQLVAEEQEDADILFADARYCVAGQWSDRTVRLAKTKSRTLTEKIDQVVLNRFLGIPIFLFIMYLMFVFSINVGGALQDFFDLASASIFVDGLTVLLQGVHCPLWLMAILANGVGRGINTVVSFAPVIGAMFLFLALLEDGGYMARAAFVMDRFMQYLGLPGRSFVPMIVGFGCNVPAVLGARTLANPRDRILTVMMMPFMSCGARLAIFSVFASAFFPAHGAGLIFLLYLLGILVAVLSGLALRNTLLPGKPAPLVMELPTYHLPKLSSLLKHAWQRLKGFVWRAGKYIVPICVLIGALNSLTVQGTLVPEGNPRSLLSHVGRWVTPVLSPMGIRDENWPATVGLMTGVLAKEVVIGTLNSLYSTAPQASSSDFDLLTGLKKAVMSVPSNFSALGAAIMNPVAASQPLHDMTAGSYGVMVARFGGMAAAFSYLVFVLLYFPCISTMAAMRREIGAGWAYFSLGWSLGLAYVLAVISYQLLTFAEHPLGSCLWLALAVTALWGAVRMLRRAAERPGSKEVSDALSLT